MKRRTKRFAGRFIKAAGMTVLYIVYRKAGDKMSRAVDRKFGW